jgi:hypothetical protein
MTFFNVSAAPTINAGDVDYIPQTLRHYVENTGDTDLVFLEMFKAPPCQDISVNDWPTHLSPELVIAHLDTSRATSAAIPKADPAAGLIPPMRWRYNPPKLRSGHREPTPHRLKEQNTRQHLSVLDLHAGRSLSTAEKALNNKSLKLTSIQS